MRSKPSCAKQWISRIQLAVTSRAKYYKKIMRHVLNRCATTKTPKLVLTLFPDLFGDGGPEDGGDLPRGREGRQAVVPDPATVRSQEAAQGKNGQS